MARSLLALTLLPLATAFTLSTAPIRAATVPSTPSVTMGMFDGFSKAFDCQEGTCKTCEAQLSPGGKTKICVARMPAKDVTIKYNLRF